MKFQAKIFKLGNAIGLYIPKGIYKDLVLEKVYTIEITEEVYTEGKDEKVYTAPNIVITEPLKAKIPFWCELKHKGRGVNARRCGCYAV